MTTATMNAPTLTTAPSPILYTDLLRCTAQVMLKENTWRDSKAPRFAVITYPDSEILDTFSTREDADEFFSDASLHFVRGEAFPDPDETAVVATDKGRAALAYQNAQADYWNAFASSCRSTADNTPKWDAPEVVAAGIVMEVAAMAYRELGGEICEDCGMLEQCVCPDGSPC